MDFWGRGRAGRILWRLADTRTDGVCRRGGFLDARPRGLHNLGRVDAQAARGRGVIEFGDETGGSKFSHHRLYSSNPTNITVLGSITHPAWPLLSMSSRSTATPGSNLST